MTNDESASSISVWMTNQRVHKNWMECEVLIYCPSCMLINRQINRFSHLQNRNRFKKKNARYIVYLLSYFSVQYIHYTTSLQLQYIIIKNIFSAFEAYVFHKKDLLNGSVAHQPQKDQLTCCKGRKLGWTIKGMLETLLPPNTLNYFHIISDFWKASADFLIGI